jgi:hypothetical protein
MRENARQLIDRAAGANGTTILTVSAKAGAASKVAAAQRPIARRFILFPPSIRLTMRCRYPGSMFQPGRAGKYSGTSLKAERASLHTAINRMAEQAGYAFGSRSQ